MQTALKFDASKVCQFPLKVLEFYCGESVKTVKRKAKTKPFGKVTNGNLFFCQIGLLSE